MPFIVLILAFAGTLLPACAPKGNIGDYIPQWAGGPPKNLPPRPGTPEYAEFKQRLHAERGPQKNNSFKKRVDAEAAREKSNDPPSQKPTDCPEGACPQR